MSGRMGEEAKELRSTEAPVAQSVSVWYLQEVQIGRYRTSMGQYSTVQGME